MVRIVNLILSSAAKMSASDIHLEPKEDYRQVRQRAEKKTGALEIGADDYVLKPVEPRRLAARVKSALIRTRERGALGTP